MSKKESEIDGPVLRRSSRLCAVSPVPSMDSSHSDLLKTPPKGPVTRRRASVSKESDNESVTDVSKIPRAKNTSISSENEASLEKNEVTRRISTRRRSNSSVPDSPAKKEEIPDEKSPKKIVRLSAIPELATPQKDATKDIEINKENLLPDDEAEKDECKEVEKKAETVVNSLPEVEEAAPIAENKSETELNKENLQPDEKNKEKEAKNTSLNKSLVVELEKLSNGTLEKCLSPNKSFEVDVVGLDSPQVRRSPRNLSLKKPPVKSDSEEANVSVEETKIEVTPAKETSLKSPEPSKDVKDDENGEKLVEKVDSRPKEEKETSLTSPQTSTPLKDAKNDEIEEKIDTLLEVVLNESESDPETKNSNSFLDMEAEEGEEDTPSEGSNDIIEKGEDLNSTASDYSIGSYDDDDSFIVDGETHDLLSGSDFDLSFEDLKEKKLLKKTMPRAKRSRIIGLSSGSDEDGAIVVIDRAKKPKKAVRKSRIVEQVNSSEEEGENEEKKTEIVEIEEIVEIKPIEELEINENNKEVEEVEVEMEKIDENQAGDVKNSSSGSSNGTLVVEEKVEDDEPAKPESHIIIHENIRVDAENQYSGLKIKSAFEVFHQVNESVKKDENTKIDEIKPEIANEVTQKPGDTSSIGKKKRKRNKRRRKAKKATIEEEDDDDDQPKAKKAKIVEVKSQSVLDSAVQAQKRRLFQLAPSTSYLEDGWDIKKIVKAKPSTEGKLDKTIEEKVINKEIDKKTTKKRNKKKSKPQMQLGINNKEIHAKDFKNIMIFDQTRNSRMGTKDVLSKKGAFFN